MDELRLILLLVGVGVIALVYAWSRFQQRPGKRSAKRSPPPRRSRDPDDLDAADIEQELGRMERLVMDQDDNSDRMAAERLLIVSVVAAQGDHFSGEALLKGFEHNKLHFGEKDIYYRLTARAGKAQPVFGVANMVKPGTFPAADMDSFTTPGLTLFLQLPGPIDGLEAFDDFVHTAERLAVELGGELRDERHGLLTHQVLMHLRESIVKDRRCRRAVSQ